MASHFYSCICPTCRLDSFSFINVLHAGDDRVKTLYSLSYFSMSCIGFPAFLVFIFIIRSQSSTHTNRLDSRDEKSANTVKFEKRLRLFRTQEENLSCISLVNLLCVKLQSWAGTSETQYKKIGGN